MRLSTAARSFARALAMSSSRKWSLLAGSGAALVGAGFLLNQETPLFPCRVALAEGTPLGGLPGTEKERTFIAIKPDGVHRALVGELIQRFERKGYTLVGLKLLQPTEEMAQKHYSDLSSKPFFPSLTKYFSSGPIVAMVWQGKDVVKQGRVILGATNPRASSPGTVRGDYCIDLGRNVMHGSDSTDSAIKEITFWFKDGEVVDWKRAGHEWIYE